MRRLQRQQSPDESGLKAPAVPIHRDFRCGGIDAAFDSAAKGGEWLHPKVSKSQQNWSTSLYCEAFSLTSDCQRMGNELTNGFGQFATSFVYSLSIR
jgi:hypothetical protein